MRLAIVTSNPHKAREMAAFLGGEIACDHVPFDCPEFKHDDIGEIARGKAHSAYEALRRPLIVDDTGFSIQVLNGFPGPYAAYVLGTIGNTGILRLLEGQEDRSAFFETAIAYTDGRVTQLFRGRIEGAIVPPRGTGGFGYDPIFEWNGRTLAELSPEEKNRVSHRAAALGAFRKWFTGPGGPAAPPPGG